MANNKCVKEIDDRDVKVVTGAIKRASEAYSKILNWRKVGEYFKVRHEYVYNLVMYQEVPANKEIRKLLGIPKILPSEMKSKKHKSFKRIGEAGWEGDYLVVLKFQKYRNKNPR